MKRWGNLFGFGMGTALLLSFCWMGNAAADSPMDLGKAVKIGSGRNVVIEFTDPDCNFCRAAEAFFRKRPDVTRYIFLNPLSIHPEARVKAEFILSAPDRARAYEETMAGKFDEALPAGITDAGRSLLEEHMEVARDAGIDATPVFMIGGRIIRGLDKGKIGNALGD